MGESLNLLPEDGASLILAGALLSANPFIFVLVDLLERFVRRYPLLARLLECSTRDLSKLPTLVDERALPIVYGDASRPGILDHVHLEGARLLVVSVQDAFEARRIVELARGTNPDIETVVRTHSDHERRRLEGIGVGKVDGWDGVRRGVAIVVSFILVRATTVYQVPARGIGPHMRAVRFIQWQTFPEIVDVERPEPGPGEVLLKVAGAGACHSDVALYKEFAPDTPGAIPPPFTLGHENAGLVEEVGPGVAGVDVGASYLVYGPIGCGHCRKCSRGQDTYCENAATMPYLGIGLGRDGGMAEYVVVPSRNLVPLGDADPVAAAPLSDAGLTPYHAIKNSLPNLAGGGRFALVIGLGGLGQTAVQILTALTGATVIATDMKADAMKRAEASGAVTVPGGDDQVEKILKITHGRGVDAAFDLVGVTPTMKTAQACMAQGGRFTVVGIAGGAIEWSFFGTPYESTITNTYWGTIEDLHEVVDMYRAGQIRPEIERYSMDDALGAYRRLESGELSGRAVVVPHD